MSGLTVLLEHGDPGTIRKLADRTQPTIAVAAAPATVSMPRHPQANPVTPTAAEIVRDRWPNSVASQPAVTVGAGSTNAAAIADALVPESDLTFSKGLARRQAARAAATTAPAADQPQVKAPVAQRNPQRAHAPDRGRDRLATRPWDVRF